MPTQCKTERDTPAQQRHCRYSVAHTHTHTHTHTHLLGSHLFVLGGICGALLLRRVDALLHRRDVFLQKNKHTHENKGKWREDDKIVTQTVRRPRENTLVTPGPKTDPKCYVGSDCSRERRTGWKGTLKTPLVGSFSHARTPTEGISYSSVQQWCKADTLHLRHRTRLSHEGLLCVRQAQAQHPS